MTIDLVANLAQLEGDMGRAAQIATRTAEKMTAGQATFLKSLERTSSRLAVTQADFLRVRAAELGASDAAERFIANIEASGSAATRAGGAGATAFAAIGATVEAAGARQKAIITDLIDGIRRVNAEAERLRGQAVTERKAGAITPEVLRDRVTNVDTGRTEAVRQLKDVAAAQLATARTADAADASNAAFVVGLKRQADAIGVTRAQLLTQEAAERGVSAQAAPLIARLAEAERGTGQLGKSVFATRNQLLTLKYTLSDVVASAASGISPMTILLQQGGQLAQVEGGVGGIFKTVLSLITPLRVAAAGAAGAIGLLAYGYYEGSKQSKAFADSLVLTGNYAGVTEGQYNTLSKSVADSAHVSAASAREITQAIISTGEIGPQALSNAALAAALYEKATGKTSKEVAGEFASMTHDVAAWAADHNKQLNFVSASQYAQIKALQDQGKAADAEGVVYGALIARFQKLEANLGTIEKALNSGKNAWGRFWDAALNVGRNETIDDQLDKAKAKLKELLDLQDRRSGRRSAPVGETDADPSVNRRSGVGKSDLQRRSAAVAAAQSEVDRVQAEKDRQAAAARAQAAQDEIEKKGIDAQDFVRGYLDRAKSVEALERALAKARLGFESSAKAGKPVSDARQNEVLNQIRKDFTNPELEQTAQAQADKAIKALNDSLQQERDLLAFHNTYLQGQYNAGVVSLEHFYADRKATLEQSTAEEAAILEKQKAALRDLLGKIPSFDTSKLVETRGKLAELTAAQIKLQADATRQGLLADQEREAGLDALIVRVVEFRAQLAQLAGDEKAAAALRAQNSENAAKRFQGSAGAGSLISDSDLARLKEVTRISNDYAEVQRKVGIATERAANAEELFALRAQQSGKSLIDTERGVFAIRAQELDELAKLRDEQVKLAAASAAANNGIADPKILAYVAELTLRYEKLRDTIDPALNRLRQATESLGASLAQTFSQSLAGFDQLYSARRDSANKDAASQRDDYDKRLQQLYGYLAKAQDAQARAAIQAEITRVKGERARVGDSKTSTLLKTVERDVLGPMLRQIEQTAVKLLVEDPLKKLLQSSLKQLTEGDNFIGNFLKDTLKIGAKAVDPEAIAKQALVTATTQQTTAVGEATLTQYQATEALDLMTDAAYEAADALLEISASGGGGGGGGLLGSLGSFFGGSSGAGSGLEGMSPEDLSYFFGGHGGGVAGYFGSPIKARASDFSGAPRYHSGGVVGLQPDEVASILRRGEEVITRDDPRHRWNSGKGGGGAASMPVYLSINNNGAPVETKSKTATQTDRGLLVELVIDTIKNDADNGGPATRAIAGRLGGNTAAGVPRRGRAGF